MVLQRTWILIKYFQGPTKYPRESYKERGFLQQKHVDEDFHNKKMQSPTEDADFYEKKKFIIFLGIFITNFQSPLQAWIFYKKCLGIFIIFLQFQKETWILLKIHLSTTKNVHFLKIFVQVQQRFFSISYGIRMTEVKNHRPQQKQVFFPNNYFIFKSIFYVLNILIYFFFLVQNKKYLFTVKQRFFDQ